MLFVVEKRTVCEKKEQLQDNPSQLTGARDGQISAQVRIEKGAIR